METAHVVRRLREAGCVFAEDEAALLLATDDPEPLVARRVAGEPLETVLGWCELAGVRVHTATGVFVPRRRSALLVREALARVRPGDVVVDLCCGTGALGAAVAARVDVQLHAADVDPDAVACARRNVPRVHQGDLFDALPPGLRGRVDVLLVNAPYVPSGEVAAMPPEAREHEHRVALDGGRDGLDVHRRVAAEAASWLAPGGVLVLETSRLQAGRTRALLEGGGLRAEVVTGEPDATAVVGRRA